MVCGADDAFLFHALDQARGTVVPDLKVTLDEAGRGLALAADEFDSLVVEVVAAFIARPGLALAARLLFFAGDILNIGRMSLVFKMTDHPFHLHVRNERTMNADDAAALRHVEH